MELQHAVPPKRPWLIDDYNKWPDPVLYDDIALIASVHHMVDVTRALQSQFPRNSTNLRQLQLL